MIGDFKATSLLTFKFLLTTPTTATTSSLVGYKSGSSFTSFPCENHLKGERVFFLISPVLFSYYVVRFPSSPPLVSLIATSLPHHIQNKIIPPSQLLFMRFSCWWLWWKCGAVICQHSALRDLMYSQIWKSKVSGRNEQAWGRVHLRTMTQGELGFSGGCAEALREMGTLGIQVKSPCPHCCVWGL